jgi:hypothetical protein
VAEFWNPQALLWYVAVLYQRLRRGTAGVKPIEELMDER